MDDTRNHTKSVDLGHARERAQDKNRKLDIIMGVLFILYGVLSALVYGLKGNPADVLDLVLMPVGITLLVVVLLQGKTFLKHNLNPQDEYELHQTAINKAKAFNYLSGGLFFIMFLIPEKFAMSAVCVLLGYTWLMVARGRVDAKETV